MQAAHTHTPHTRAHTPHTRTHTHTTRAHTHKRTRTRVYTHHTHSVHGGAGAVCSITNNQENFSMKQRKLATGCCYPRVPKQAGQSAWGSVTWSHLRWAGE